MTITLKNYPPGDFTQEELAQANGMEKAAIYLPLKEAIEKGIIAKVGTRPTGKRPANLYRRTDSSSEGQAINTEISAPVPVPAPLPTQPIVVETPPAQPIQPVVTATSFPVPEHKLAPNPEFPCPLCKGPMTEIPDSTGVMVKCFNPLPCIPGCGEEPYGHGRTARDAYDIAKQKFHV